MENFTSYKYFNILREIKGILSLKDFPNPDHHLELLEKVKEFSIDFG